MSIKNGLFLNSKILEDVQILVVDNDRDNRDLYAFLLEDRGANVTTSGSIQDALDFLDWNIPSLVICEVRFLCESVLPLIQRVRSLTHSSSRTIPILVTSACSPISPAQPFAVEVEAYLLKPIDIDDFIDQVWNLTRRSSTAYPPSYPSSIQDWMTKRNRVKPLLCGTGVR